MSPAAWGLLGVAMSAILGLGATLWTSRRNSPSSVSLIVGSSNDLVAALTQEVARLREDRDEDRSRYEEDRMRHDAQMLQLRTEVEQLRTELHEYKRRFGTLDP